MLHATALSSSHPFSARRSAQRGVPRGGLAGAVMAHRLDVALVIGIALAQLFDVLTTLSGLRLGLPETNPLNAALLSGFGLLGLVGGKVAFTAAISVCVVRLGRAWAVAGGLASMVIVTVAATANLGVIGQLGR